MIDTHATFERCVKFFNHFYTYFTFDLVILLFQEEIWVVKVYLLKSQRKAQAERQKSKDHQYLAANSKVNHLTIPRVFFRKYCKISVLINVHWYSCTFLAEKENKDEQILSHRQKQRLVIRVKKQEEKKIKMSGYGRNKNKQQQQPKKKYNSESEQSEESDEDDEDDEEQQQEEENDFESDDGSEQETPGFTDENSAWLKPKKHSKIEEEESDSGDEEQDDEEEEEDGEEEEEDSDDDNLKVHLNISR